MQVRPTHDRSIGNQKGKGQNIQFPMPDELSLYESTVRQCDGVIFVSGGPPSRPRYESDNPMAILHEFMLSLCRILQL